MQVFAAKQTCFTTGDKLGKMKGDTLAIRQNLHRQLELATGFSVACSNSITVYYNCFWTGCISHVMPEISK